MGARTSHRGWRFCSMMMVVIVMALNRVHGITIESPLNPERYTYVTWNSSGKVVEQLRSEIAGKGNVVEVGSWEGGTTTIMVRELLSGDTPYKVYAFDTWEDHVEEKYSFHFNRHVYRRFLHNVGRYYGKVVAVRGQSQVMVPRYRTQLEGTVVFAYIDGDHTSQGTYEDAVNVLPLMKPGGYTLFDDYLWGDYQVDTVNTPKEGIDKFLAENKDQLDIVRQEYQLLVRKR